MAYGNFTDVAPLDNGAYQFQQRNGPSITLFGDPAEELRRKVEAAKAFERSQMTADVSQLAAVAPAMSGAQPTLADFSQQVAAAQASSGPTTAPPPSIARQEPQQGPPVGKYETILQNKGGDEIRLRQGGDPANPADYVVQERPRAATKGGLAESGRTIKGGYEPSEAYLQARQEAQQKLEMGQRIAFEAGVEKQQMEHAAQQGVMLQQELQAREALDQAEQVDKQVAEKEVTYEKALTDYKTGRVDPDRFSRGNWAAGLAVVLGTIAQAIPGKAQIPNVAKDIIDRRIEADIRSQEIELAVKKESAQNALGDLQRKLGSRQLAREALRGIRMQQAKTQLELAAGKTKDAELASAYLQTSAEVDTKYADFLENYRREAAGEITKSMRFQGGSAGSRGGLRPLTLEEGKGVIGLAPKGGAGVGGKMTEKQAAAVTGAAEAEVQAGRLDRYGDKEVAPTTETRNVFERARRGVKEFVGGAGAGTSDLSEREIAMIQDVEDAKSYIAARRSVGRGQGAIMAHEEKRFYGALAPNATIGEVKRALAMTRDVDARIMQKTGWDKAQLNQAYMGAEPETPPSEQ